MGENLKHYLSLNAVVQTLVVIVEKAQILIDDGILSGKGGNSMRTIKDRENLDIWKSTNWTVNHDPCKRECDCCF